MRQQLLHCALLGVFEFVAAQFDNIFEYTEGPLSPALEWFTDDLERLGGWVYFDSVDSLQSGGPRTGYTSHSFSLHFVGSGFRVHAKLDSGTRDPSLNELGSFWVMPNVTKAVGITRTDGVVAEWEFAGAVRPMAVHMWIPDNVSFTLCNVTALIPVSTEAPSPEEWEVAATYHPAVVNHSLNPNMSTREIPSEDRKLMGVSHVRLPQYLPSKILGEHVLLETGTQLLYRLPPNTSLVTGLGPVAFDSEWNNVMTSDISKVCTILLDPPPYWYKKEGYNVASWEMTYFRLGRPRYRDNMTIFRVPLDPRVQYTAKVMPFIEDNVYYGCITSGFKTYPFHFPGAKFIQGGGHGSHDHNATTAADKHSASDSTATLFSTSALVGAVVGTAGGILAIGMAFFAVRHYLSRRQMQTDSGSPAFEVDAGPLASFVDEQDQQPVVEAPENESSDTHRPHSDRQSILSPLLNRLSSISKTPRTSYATSRSEQPSATTPRTSQTISAISPAFVAAVVRSDTRPARRAIQAEDAEDANLDIVPPAYRDAWAQRLSQSELHDGAVAVNRSEKGERAEDLGRLA